jgi:hypothetical protein
VHIGTKILKRISWKSELEPEALYISDIPRPTTEIDSLRSASDNSSGMNISEAFLRKLHDRSLNADIFWTVQPFWHQQKTIFSICRRVAK